MTNKKIEKQAAAWSAQLDMDQLCTKKTKM